MGCRLDGKLKLGVAGLGRAFMLMLPTLAKHPRLSLVAAADPRQEARDRFAGDFSARVYETVEAMCADAGIQAVYVASPHRFHVAHVSAAAAAGKHAMVEKPMALTLDECRAMIGAARQAKVQLLVGHSHSFDAPYLRTRELIASGAFGPLRMIHALNYTDYLYRPRRPEELDTAQGGGVIFGQAPHQVEIVRLLAGARALSVRAATGRWDGSRPTEGAYSAFLTFEGGAFASLGYSGYGHFDSDEFCDWIGEMGGARDVRAYGAARAKLRQVRSVEEEIALKNARGYGTTDTAQLLAESEGALHNHFGPVIVSCERADLRPMPDGVMIYGDGKKWLEPLPPPAVPRAEVVDELCDAVLLGKPPLHSGESGMATLEICLAMLRSAQEGREIALNHQTAM